MENGAAKKLPVVSISLKGVNGADYETARSMLCAEIGNEALRFQFLLGSDKLSAQEKEIYRKLIHVDAGSTDNFEMADDVLMRSLRTLSELLRKHYGKKVIILIDEYDVPLAKANEKGYYEPMVTLIRNLFEQALKTNESLYFAVMTGCLRVAKESIFKTDLIPTSLKCWERNVIIGFLPGVFTSVLTVSTPVFILKKAIRSSQKIWFYIRKDRSMTYVYNKRTAG